MTKKKTDQAEDGQVQPISASLAEAWEETAPSDVPAEKPKRTRAKAKAEPVVEETPVVVDEAPAKPARKRTTKAAAVAEQPAEVSADPAAEAHAEQAAGAPAEAESAPKSMVDMVAEKGKKATPAPVEVEPEEAEPVEVAAVSPFQKLGLSADLLQSISSVGYEEPTPIQEMTIPVLLEGRDVIAQAQTGSGKTAAFGLPIIESIDPRNRSVQALVLCPTRELAIQVAEALHKYGRHKQVETLPIYGGQPYERQFRGLQRGPQIVVGTPGRVMDHMRRETLNLDQTRFFVLDEADEMLDMGFIEDIEWILEQVPAERQTALFSATMPPRITDLATRYLQDPARLTVAGRQMTVPETNQIFYEVPRMRKVDALTRILDAETPPLAMIFCRTKNGVDELGEALLARGYQAETLHGDLSQVQRDRVMRRFRTGQADILIATDVAARGLDIPNVTHVINFDIPESSEAYVHRIGRTGRAGRKGEAITLVTPRETRWLRQIERTIRAKIDGRRLPTTQDVAERRRELLKQQVQEILADETSYAYYTAVVDDLAEDHDASQVAAALMKLYAEESGRGAPPEPTQDDIAVVTQPVPRPERFDRERPRFEGGPREMAPRGESGNVRLFINIGRNFNVRPQDIVGAIANEAGIPGRAIGSIDIFESYSFVEVPGQEAERVIDALIRSGIKGKSVNAEVARPDAAPRGPRRDFGDRDGDRFDRGPRREGGYGRFDSDRGPRRDFGDRDRGPGAPGGGYDRRPPFERDRYDNRTARPGERRDDGPRPYQRRDDAPRQFERRDDRGPRRDY